MEYDNIQEITKEQDKKDEIQPETADSAISERIATVTLQSDDEFNVQKEHTINVQDEYKDRNQLCSQQTVVINNIEKDTEEFLCQSSDITQNENTPSAPLFEDEEIVNPPAYNTQFISTEEHKIKSLPLEEAVRLFGGAEIAEVRSISEKEEAIVEAGPVSGPEHPLVDLLSSFR